MIAEFTEYIGVNNVEVTEIVTEIHVEYADMGAPGLSAYQIAVIHGYTGTQAQWIAEFQTKSWWDLIIGKQSTGTQVSITTGTVKPFVFAALAGGTVTLYRYKATNKSIDAFYSGFNGTTLTGLVTQKKVTL